MIFSGLLRVIRKGKRKKEFFYKIVKFNWTDARYMTCCQKKRRFAFPYQMPYEFVNEDHYGYSWIRIAAKRPLLIFLYAGICFRLHSPTDVKVQKTSLPLFNKRADFFQIHRLKKEKRTLFLQSSFLFSLPFHSSFAMLFFLKVLWHQ